MYLGAFPDFSSETRNEDLVTRGRIERFERLSGRRIGWAYFSNHWQGGRIVFPAGAVRLIWAEGALPFVRMMPWSTQREGRPDRVFRMIDIARGRWDRALRGWAARARQTGIPLMIDFGVEMNGDWFPWNGKWAGGLAGAHAYRDAYGHIVELFRKEHVWNASFAFHIDAEGEPAAGWNRVRNYYPGDRYIDWVGMSAYGAVDTGEDWQSFERKLRDGYGQLTAISSRPIAVFEWGVVESPAKGDKAGWIRDAFRALRSGRFPRVKAISWWQEKWQQPNGRWDSTTIDSDPAALRAYRQGIASARFVTRPKFSCAG